VAYRSPSPPDEKPPLVVRYGYFGPRPLEVLLSLGLLGVGVAMILSTVSSSESFTCERGPRGISCVIEEHRLWGDRVRELSGADIAAVEWVAYTGSKRSERGRTEIFDRAGRPLIVADGPRQEARASYERIDAFFQDPSQRRLRIEESSSWLAWLIGPGLAVIGLVLAGAALRRPTGVRAVVHPSRRTVEVAERWLGIPLRRHELSLEDVERVDVQRGHVQRLYHRGRQRGDDAGAVMLRYRDGRASPLTEDLLPGTEVHDRMAEVLRAQAGLASNERAGTPEPAPPPPAPVPDSPHAPKNVLEWWLSTIAVVSIVGFGIQLFLERDDGRLHVKCEHRCRFDGMDCRPGGEVAMSKPPGEHVIEVFDPEHEAGWRPVTVTVRQGETTTFHCR